MFRNSPGPQAHIDIGPGAGPVNLREFWLWACGPGPSTEIFLSENYWTCAEVHTWHFEILRSYFKTMTLFVSFFFNSEHAQIQPRPTGPNKHWACSLACEFKRRLTVGLWAWTVYRNISIKKILDMRRNANVTLWKFQNNFKSYFKTMTLFVTCFLNSEHAHKEFRPTGPNQHWAWSWACDFNSVLTVGLWAWTVKRNKFSENIWTCA